MSLSTKKKFTARVLPFIVLALVLMLIPMMGVSRTAYSLLNVMGINIVFALSYNMLLGQTGMLSFGHAVYFGLGGFGAMHAMNWIENAAANSFWASYPIFALPILAFGFGALAGGVIGWPSCRRSGVPFAMISLGVAEFVAAAGFMFASLFGGEEGISGDRMNGVRVLGISLGPINEVYIYIAFWTFIGIVLMYAFTRTPLGRMAEAVRDNPERVEFVGYDPQHIRYLVFIVSGGFAGFAGGMAAVNYEILTPESMSLAPSGMVLLMAYIGGARYFYGPIIGAAFLTLMQSNLSDYTDAWLLYLGLLFIVIVMYAPGGLASLLTNMSKSYRQIRDFRYLSRLLMFVLGGLLLVLGGIFIIELMVRLSNGFGEAFEPFGLHFSPNSVSSWGLSFICLALGIYLCRRHLSERGQ